MIGIAWNCRGIGQPSTVRSLKLLIKKHRPDFVFLSEVKCNRFDMAEKLVHCIGFQNFEFVPSRGKSGGLLLIWRQCIKIQVIVAHDNYINSLVFDELFEEPWQMTTVYGPPIPQQRPFFWDCMDTIGNSFNGAWMMIGDFNAVLSSADKVGGKPVASSSNGGFRRMIDDNGLIDLGFDGYAYTWNNRRGGLANIQERLDRGFANAQWKLQFPNAYISHLTAHSSDHKPLLINMSSSHDNLPRPFKFESMWITHLESANVIQAAWNSHTSFAARLKATKLALKEWNKTTFGNIRIKIEFLQKAIKDT